MGTPGTKMQRCHPHSGRPYLSVWQAKRRVTEGKWWGGPLSLRALRLEWEVGTQSCRHRVEGTWWVSEQRQESVLGSGVFGEGHCGTGLGGEHGDE